MGITGKIRASPAKAAASVAKAIKRQAAMIALVNDKPVFDQLEEATARDQKKVEPHADAHPRRDDHKVVAV